MVLILDALTLVTLLSRSIFCFDPRSMKLINKQSWCSPKIDLNKNVNRKVLTREMLCAANGNQKKDARNTGILMSETEGTACHSLKLWTQISACMWPFTW